MEAVRRANVAQAAPATDHPARTGRFGGPSGGALRPPGGASRQEEERSRRDGSDAIAPGDAGPPTGSHRFGRAGATAPWPRPRVPEYLRVRRRKPGETRPPADGHYESERPFDTGRRGHVRGHGIRCRKRRGITDADDAGEIGYCSGNGACIADRLRRFRFAPESQPEDPKGSWLRPVTGRRYVLRDVRAHRGRPWVRYGPPSGAPFLEPGSDRKGRRIHRPSRRG